ncbi:hypothetical protein B0T14DRAFT_597122 [Immersiella caudata]|uniref:Uncharacterized protein n=1 Tax=Immersiella caudata TaxID=314043 RepID=A0AA39XCL7_9PEZI|nr:hypothetical protein B0T14DRAFT_597122 [Immersiella caudata]
MAATTFLGCRRSSTDNSIISTVFATDSEKLALNSAADKSQALSAPAYPARRRSENFRDELIVLNEQQSDDSQELTSPTRTSPVSDASSITTIDSDNKSDSRQEIAALIIGGEPKTLATADDAASFAMNKISAKYSSTATENDHTKAGIANSAERSAAPKTEIRKTAAAKPMVTQDSQQSSFQRYVTTVFRQVCPESPGTSTATKTKKTTSTSQGTFKKNLPAVSNTDYSVDTPPSSVVKRKESIEATEGKLVTSLNAAAFFEAANSTMSTIAAKYSKPKHNDTALSTTDNSQTINHRPLAVKVVKDFAVPVQFDQQYLLASDGIVYLAMRYAKKKIRPLKEGEIKDFYDLPGALEAHCAIMAGVDPNYETDSVMEVRLRYGVY